MPGEGPGERLLNTSPMSHLELDPQSLPHIDSLLEKGLREKLYLCAVYTIVSREKVLACRALGRVSEEPEQPATVETVFDLASLTKPICTVTAVMLLAQRGVFHLG